MAGTQTSRVTYDFVTRAIARTLGHPGKGYYALLGTAVALLGVGIVCLLLLLRYGLGLAGYSHPVYWAVYITCFVFWVGIAHSGTLISAILFLFRSGWRTAVYRTAEAMTVFAVITAGLFPLIHIGRQWYFYWLVPYPNERGLWPNFKSPLIWDEFAIGTYLTVSTVFLIMGLIPTSPRCGTWRPGGARSCTRSPRSGGAGPTSNGATTPAAISTSPPSRRRSC